jgi:hypothetical protein
MKKLIVVLLFPMSAFAQDDFKIELCSESGPEEHSGVGSKYLSCRKDSETGFALIFGFGEKNDSVWYTGLMIMSYGISQNIDSSRAQFTFSDGEVVEMKAWMNGCTKICSHFDFFGKFLDKLLEKPLTNIKYINLGNGESISYSLKGDDYHFFAKVKEAIDTKSVEWKNCL